MFVYGTSAYQDLKMCFFFETFWSCMRKQSAWQQDCLLKVKQGRRFNTRPRHSPGIWLQLRFELFIYQFYIAVSRYCVVFVLDFALLNCNFYIVIRVYEWNFIYHYYVVISRYWAIFFSFCLLYLSGLCRYK